MCGTMRGRFGRGRPKIPRLISEIPKVKSFKPEMIDGEDTKEVITLTFEEIEAIRLVDYLNYTHEDAADAMGISRRVFWNILKSGRKKISDAIINGKKIVIEGGHFSLRGCGFFKKCGRKKHCLFNPFYQCKSENME